MKLNPLISGRTQYTLPQAGSFRWKLDIIENQFPHHPNVIQAAKDAMCDLNLYPHPSPLYAKLLTQIAQYANCNANQIILTNGSDSALKLLCDCYITRDTNVVIPQPTYPHMLQFVETVTDQVKTVNIKLGETSNEITNKIIAAIDNTNLCYLVSPNLPLGYVFSANEIELMLKSHPNTLFIVDLAYVEFGGVDYSTLLNYKNLVLVRTMSKSFGLAAIRLGYLYSHIENIKYMQAVVNDKNITMSAVATASAAFDNLDYYRSTVNKIENMKLELAKKLGDICNDDAPIFGYNISGGNYYLLLARDTASVCDVFKSYGIYVRDKHNDVPNAIRVAIGREEQNADVIDIVRLINLKSIFKHHKLIFDLDNTLRRTSKNTIPPFRGAKLIKSQNSYICTNNTSYQPKEIAEYFAKYGIDIPSEKIFSPLTLAKKVLTGKYAVLGSQNIINYFTNSVPFDETVDYIYLANKHFLDEPTIIKLCKYKKKVYYTSGGDSIDLDNYADSDEFGNYTIPDIGYIANMLSKYVETEPIGKPQAEMFPISKTDEKLVVIGDSSSDQQLAQNLGALFIHISSNTTEKIQCEFGGIISVPTINHLYDYLKIESHELKSI